VEALNELAVKVLGFIGSLNVAVSRKEGGAAASLLTGDVAITVGATPPFVEPSVDPFVDPLVLDVVPGVISASPAHPIRSKQAANTASPMLSKRLFMFVLDHMPGEASKHSP
jgi:hypothetical protein